MGVQQYTIKVLYKCLVHSFIHSNTSFTQKKSAAQKRSDHWPVWKPCFFLCRNHKVLLPMQIQNILLNAIKTSIYWQNLSLPAGPAHLFSVLQILQLWLTCQSNMTFYYKGSSLNMLSKSTDIKWVGKNINKQKSHNFKWF